LAEATRTGYGDFLAALGRLRDEGAVGVVEFASEPGCPSGRAGGVSDDTPLVPWEAVDRI